MAYSGCCDKTIENEYGEVDLHKVAVRNMLFNREISAEAYCRLWTDHEFDDFFDNGSPTCYCGKKQNYDFEWYEILKEMNT
uniref:Uncharacterized protein n=1 Tax=viral metagenome TaxID=1070528 RepID=A0A6M3J0U4_9ZZZZ